jgi:hypothetical protein
MEGINSIFRVEEQTKEEPSMNQATNRAVAYSLFLKMEAGCKQ